MAMLTVALLCLFVVPVIGDATPLLASLSKCAFLQGSEELKQFKQTNSVRVIYYYKKDVQSLKFFLKELDKAAEYLDLYGVKTGICDCTDVKNKGLIDCNELSEKNVYTYRSGSILLSLELETMFDVNSIMSNILQLVLLREVPILQSPGELKKYLDKFRGKQDVIFGHMKAIGTFDHRVFMEVAFAYQEKIKFAICTDKEATTLFNERPMENDRSTVWWVSTKTMNKDDKQMTSVLYKGELNLAAFAKFAMSISLPKMFDLPGDGREHPYAPLGLSLVRFYYNAESRDNMYEKAEVVSKNFMGLVSIVLINMDSKEQKQQYNIPFGPPAASLQMKGEDSEYFAPEGFSSDTLALFLDSYLKRESTMTTASGDHMYTADLEDEDQNREPREMRDMPPNLNIEEVEVQDDEVAEAVYGLRKKQLNLDVIPTLTDKTFPQHLKSSSLTMVMFYFPFDYISMANLIKFADATIRLGTSSHLRVARVNCYDWTDVCHQQAISIWPTLRVLRDGVHSWDYKGPQDTPTMYSTMKLLDLSPPVHLTDKEAVMKYIVGDSTLSDITNTSVIGLFSPKDKKEMTVFKEIAQDFSNRIMYAYSDINKAAEVAGQYGGKLPALLLCKYDDPLQPYILYSGPFSKDSIQEFIYNNKLPKLPELTPLMFPEIRRRSSNLVILFTDETDQSERSHDALREVVKLQTYKNVSFTLMNTPDKNCVGYKVLSQYTYSPAVPFLSFVNFNKGEVYNFEGMLHDSDHVTKWLGTVIDRSLPPSVMLSEGEWKPVNKGYEFLKIIEYEKEQAKKGKKDTKEKKNNMPSGNEDLEETDGSMPYPHMNAEMEGEEDADMRKDLIDLVNSRLYHQNQARQDKHSHQSQDSQGQTTKATGHDPGEL